MINPIYFVGGGFLILCILEIVITVRNPRLGLILPLLTAVFTWIFPMIFPPMGMLSVMTPFVFILVILHFLTKWAARNRRNYSNRSQK